MKSIALLLAVLTVCYISFSQSVGLGTTTPHASAALDISSNNKGLLMPRMTTAERTAIVSPAKALLVYDTNLNEYCYYTGTAWKVLSANKYSNDSNLVVGKQTGTIPVYNLTANVTRSDSSAYLYDSGGPVGNYGNNENFQLNMTSGTNIIAVDVQVLMNDTEGTYDSIFLTDSYNHQYTLTGNAAGSFRLFGTVRIRFKSNHQNTQAGFYIRWDKIYTKSNSDDYDNTQLTGWYFNSAKLYMRGAANINNNWSPDSSGAYSFAYGLNNKAKGISSVAMGQNTTASGSHSTALGNQTIASGIYSTALGYDNESTGSFSFSMGQQTTASGSLSIATGYSTIASGSYSTAHGFVTKASATLSSAAGHWTTSKSYAGTVIGVYNDTTNAADPLNPNPLNRLFQIGNGTSSTQRSNAMTVLGNGKVGIGVTDPIDILEVADRIRLRSGPAGSAGIWLNKPDNSAPAGFIGNVDANTIGMYGHDGAGWHFVMKTTNGNIGIGNLSPNEKLTVNGNVAASGNLIAQGNKGIIRNNTSAQLKMVTTMVAINYTATPIAAGSTVIQNISWAETFTDVPVSYVGSVAGGLGGWAELVLTITNCTTTGALLWIYNPKAVAVSPDYVINIIAMGAQ